MTKLPMKSLILSLFLVFALFQNASAEVTPPVFDIPVHDAVASIPQKFRSIDAFLTLYINTPTIRFVVPTTSSEIRVYSSNGNLVGHNNFYLKNWTNLLMPIFIDALDMAEGEEFRIVLWNSIDLTETELAVTAWNESLSDSLYPLECKYYYASVLVTELIALKQPTQLVSIIDQESLKIYPNPAFNVLNISLPENDMNLPTEIEVVDLLGGLIKKFSLIDTLKGNIQLDVSDIPNGVYLVQIKGAVISTSKKIVINH